MHVLTDKLSIIDDLSALKFSIQVKRKESKLYVVSGKAMCEEGDDQRCLNNKRMHIDSVLSRTPGVLLFFSSIGMYESKGGRRDRRVKK